MIDIDEWLSRMVEEESTTTESNVKGNAKRESMFGFRKFMDVCNVTNHDISLTVTFAGNISAEWRNKENHRIAIEFFDKHNVKYVIFEPSASDPKRMDRYHGYCTIYSGMIGWWGGSSKLLYREKVL